MGLREFIRIAATEPPEADKRQRLRQEYGGLARLSRRQYERRRIVIAAYMVVWWGGVLALAIHASRGVDWWWLLPVYWLVFLVLAPDLRDMRSYRSYRRDWLIANESEPPTPSRVAGVQGAQPNA